MRKLKHYYGTCVLCFVLILSASCSAGGGSSLTNNGVNDSSNGNSDGNNNLPNGSQGYLLFSESSIIIKSGESAMVTLSVVDSSQAITAPFPVDVQDSSVATVTPDNCELNDNIPPSCNLIVTGINAGQTIIGAYILPGQPLMVTVTD